MKKRFLTILLATTMVFSLVGCGSASEAEAGETAGEVETESVVEVVEEQTVNEGETEAETVNEQAEESGAVEKLEGFQYQITFDVDGTQKSIGFNTPEGYEVEVAEENYYKFVNVNNDYFSIAPFTLDGYGEEALAAYDNYLSTGEWNGLYGEFLSEEFLSERTIEVPGGTAKIITGVQGDLFKNQSVFVEFDGCIVGITMPQATDSIDYMSNEITSGTEDEYIIDEVLAQLFVKTENTDYLYPISESTVEITEGTYEYELSYYDIVNESAVAYMGFNLPEGDFAQSEDDIAMNEEYSQYGISNYEFTDSKGNMIAIAETDGTGSPYQTVCVYRHFLRTGEMSEGVERTFMGEGGIWDMHTGTLVDMQLGETVETPYGTVNIVKGLWQYDILTEVTETVIFKVNDREVFVTLHNKNAEPGVTLDSYESQLAGMLAEMF